MSATDTAAANNDREIWRERDGDYYADSIHVTEHGGIGIDCGGTVIVMPVRKWHKLPAALDRLLTAGNHIATYRTERWPDYQLDGLTRREQCEHALRILGATRDYDMWCCWSAMMQARDELEVK